MAERTFNKKCNIRILNNQLVTAGFAIDGISYDSGTNITTIFLKSSETKDPTTIVNSHVYTADLTPDWKSEYQLAVVAGQARVNNMLSKYLGFVALTDHEYLTGKLD